MRSVSLKLVALFALVACASASAWAQETSVFRYASDPFSEEGAATEEEAAEESAEPSEKESEKASYDSYESWPNGVKNPVQRKAIFRAQQREQRIAARQWYGYSQSRPVVVGNPYYMEAYSLPIWSTTGSGPDMYGPFGWYYPRRSLSAYRWAPYSYAARLLP